MLLNLTSDELLSTTRSVRKRLDFTRPVEPEIVRARGLGAAWTTSHLEEERDAAEIVGIPYESVTQTALLPVAYTIGTDFKPGTRQPLDAVICWNTWTA
jgi:hypothetical protein